jgi:hypothetical protein
MNKKQKRSFAVAIFGLSSLVFLEIAHTPGEGITKTSVDMGIAALAIMRLYLFYEGAAMIDISRKKAKVAFILSLVLTAFLIAYGIAIYLVNPAFKHYQLFLFLILTISLAAVEWVFSERIGADTETELSKLMDKLEIANAENLDMSGKVNQQAEKIAQLEDRINTLSAENAKLSELRPRVAKLEKITSSNKVFHYTGRPYKLCPSCLEEGKVNLLGGGTKSTHLECSKHGKIKIT